MPSGGLPPALVEKIGVLAESRGLELVEAVFGPMESGRTLRILLDREGGIKPEDCEGLARALGPLLDEEGDLGGRYLLEVSSAGLERPLVRAGDYRRFAGREARVSFRREGKKVTLEGKLEGLEEDAALLRVGEVLERVPLAEVIKAKLVFHYGGRKG